MLQMGTATRYGYFRDALYYLACADHLAFGYVDQPPLFPFIAWIARHTLGTSLPALIFWPALAGAARIILIAALARELGAKRFGVALAAALAATPAVWWVIDHQFAMNTFEPLFWTGCAYVMVRMMHTENPKLWLRFGAIAGLGLENKYSIAVFVFALLLGLLLTPQRKLLFTPWLFAGGALAFALFLPNLIWNIRHHWPFLELMHNIRATGKDVVYPPTAYIAQQIVMMNPFSFPFWFSGLLFAFSLAPRSSAAFSAGPSSSPSRFSSFLTARTIIPLPRIQFCSPQGRSQSNICLHAPRSRQKISKRVKGNKSGHQNGARPSSRSASRGLPSASGSFCQSFFPCSRWILWSITSRIPLYSQSRPSAAC